MESLVKKTIFNDEQKTERVQKLRTDFANSIKDIPPEKFVFLDESGVSVGMTRNYARCIKGQPIHGYVRSKKGGNLTIIGSLRKKGPGAMMTLPGAMDGHAFHAYVEHLLVKTLSVGDVVVMDNLPVHKMSRIIKIIEDVGARVMFLPPYSPDFNPIEKMWSKMKAALRSMQAKNYEDLLKGVSHALRIISPQDAQGWFRSCNV